MEHQILNKLELWSLLCGSWVKILLDILAGVALLLFWIMHPTTKLGVLSKKEIQRYIDISRYWPTFFSFSHSKNPFVVRCKNRSIMFWHPRFVPVRFDKRKHNRFPWPFVFLMIRPVWKLFTNWNGNYGMLIVVHSGAKNLLKKCNICKYFNTNFIWHSAL